ncbi:MAG: sigma-70 family RNA polymerase sigma factor [Planctomycetota bacterium]
MAPAESNSSDLFARAVGGDADSLDELLRRFREPLLRRLRLMLGPQARRQAESVDFMQQVFTTAVEHQSDLEGLDDAALLRWLTATARNRVRASVRGRWAAGFETLSISLGGVAPPESPSNATPSGAAAQREGVEHLLESLEGLAEEHRRVIELRDFEGLPFAEVGAAMDRGENAARMLHARAMVKLAQHVRRRSG